VNWKGKKQMSEIYQKTLEKSQKFSHANRLYAVSSKDYAPPTMNPGQRFIQAVTVLIVGLLTVRFLLALYGVAVTQQYASVVFRISAPFLLPFQGILGTADSLTGMRIDSTALIGIIMYILTGFILVKAIDALRQN
jgi:hypothetical protein